MARITATTVAVLLALAAASRAESGDLFDFNDYRVSDIYSGKLQLPDFGARDKGFGEFKTRITDAMTAGVTFAGEFSIMHAGCGTGCSFVVVANKRTGKLYEFPRGGEFNQALKLEYKANSRLILARWYTDSVWETCVIESFVLDGGRWIAKEALSGKSEAICEGGVAAGAKRAKTF